MLPWVDGLQLVQDSYLEVDLAWMCLQMKRNGIEGGNKHAKIKVCCNEHQIDGLVQERHHSSALAMELRLSCTNPSKSIMNS